MKIKELILDFTPLLDITMIILFWFIMNSHDQTVAVTQKADEAIAAATSLSSELEEKLADNEREMAEWRIEAQQELENIRSADSDAAGNMQALLDHQNGTSIVMDLSTHSAGDWTLSIRCGDDILGRTGSDNGLSIIDPDTRDKLGREIVSILEAADTDAEQTMICTVLYDGDSLYSGRARAALESALTDVRRTYKKMYCSIIDKGGHINE